MARKKKKEPGTLKLSVQEQIDWIRAHKNSNLFVSEPAQTTILELFTMLDDVVITIGSDQGSLVTYAGAYKKFLSDENPALFTFLSQQAATVL